MTIVVFIDIICTVSFFIFIAFIGSDRAAVFIMGEVVCCSIYYGRGSMWMVYSGGMNLLGLYSIIFKL